MSELTRVFGPVKTASALATSPLFSAEADLWEEMILYSTETSLYWLHCSRTRGTELQAVVEPKDGDVREACDSALIGLLDALSRWNPRVTKAEITELNRPIFRGQSGIWAHVSASETRLAILIGLVNIVWIGVAYLTLARNSLVDLLTGGIPATLTALAFVSQALLATKRRAVNWKG